MLDILGMILFWLILIIGFVSIFFGVAGTFIIFADALGFAIITHFEKITWTVLGVLLALAIIVELLELALAGAAARKFGSSKAAAWGAIIGGLLGAIILTPFAPLIGTIFGGFLGAFLGALLVELISSEDFNKSIRSAWGAFLGVLGGKVIKITVAIIMIVMIGVRVF